MNPLNVSVQVGDYAYFVATQPSSQTQNGTGFLVNSSNIFEIGQITAIILTAPAPYNNFIICEWDDSVGGHLVGIGDFIMFSKDNAANMASILGYYAEVEMVNDSNEKAKLFAVSADVDESSK
jgi:hypothetical protein